MAKRETFYRKLVDSISDGVLFVDSHRKIMQWNKGAERLTGYSVSEVSDRKCSATDIIHVDEKGVKLCKHQCPHDKPLKDGVSTHTDAYLQHRDGHRIPVRITVSPVIDEEGKTVGTIEVFRDNFLKRLDAQLMEDLEKAELLDPESGLANRKYVEMKIRSALEELIRHNAPFGLIMAEIDDFDDVKATYGSQDAAEIFRKVGRAFEEVVRASDLVGRWRQDELAVIFAHVHEEQIVRLANKLRVIVEGLIHNVDNEIIVRLTATMGVTLAHKDDTVESLVGRASDLLWKGKLVGNNCVFSER